MHTGKTGDNLTQISAHGIGWQAPLIDLDRKFQLLDPDYKFLYVNKTARDTHESKEIYVTLFDKANKRHPYADKYEQLLLNTCSESGVYVKSETDLGCNYRFIMNRDWEGETIDTPNNKLFFETKENVNNFFNYYHSMLQPDYYLKDTIYDQAPIMDWLNFTTAISQLGLSPYVENRGMINEDSYWIIEDNDDEWYGNVKSSNFIPAPILMKINVKPSYDSIEWNINPGAFHKGVSLTTDFTNTFVNYRSVLSSIRSTYLKAFNYAQANNLETSTHNIGFIIAMSTLGDQKNPEDALISIKNFLNGKLQMSESLLRLLLNKSVNSEEILYYKDLPLELIYDLTNN